MNNFFCLLALLFFISNISAAQDQGGVTLATDSEITTALRYNRCPEIIDIARELLLISFDEDVDYETRLRAHHKHTRVHTQAFYCQMGKQPVEV